ncbi:MAG: lipid II flippase Amj family protein [Thermoanaerobaculia bacterium]
MDTDLLTIFALTFVIHLIGTLAYSARIAGTRTGRIAVSFALFNILVLVSRTSNSFQVPLLAKRVEENLKHGVEAGVTSDFRWALAAATIATVVGAFLIPTFQRVFGRAVQAFSVHRSVPRLLLGGLSPESWGTLRDSMRVPARENLTRLPGGTRLPAGVIVFQTLATAVWTVGVFSSLYAGYLHPALRMTSSSLSSIINGVATILTFVFLDPYLSVLTDDVVEGRISEGYFRRSVVWLVGGRLAGTVLAQLLLVPSAAAIVYVAERL